MAHHRRGLRRHLRNDPLAEAVEADWQASAITTKQKAMLAYSQKLTVKPASMAKSDVTSLREVGFDDQDILAIAEITAYYAYVNRIADGLGVQLESD